MRYENGYLFLKIRKKVLESCRERGRTYDYLTFMKILCEYIYELRTEAALAALTTGVPRALELKARTPKVRPFLAGIIWMISVVFIMRSIIHAYA